jgi:hypothetical protein
LKPLRQLGRFGLFDIRRVWHLIKADIEFLITRYRLDFRPEDVYAQCLIGRAFCYLCDNGFLIVKPQENQFTLEPELFVWICCGEGDNLIDDYYEDLLLIAQDIHAVRIVFETPRYGWKKYAKAKGWEPAMVTYRFPV